MADQEKLHPLRPFLKNWIWEHGRVGTRYLDYVDGEIKFDEGKKSRFAAEKYIYVPLDKDGEDAVAAEGPAIQEAGLARFLRAAQLGTPDEAGSVAEIQRAVQDCVELGLFSAYQAEAREATARYAQEPMFEDEIRAAVVDDIRRIYGGAGATVALRFQCALRLALAAADQRDAIHRLARACKSGTTVCIASVGALLPAGRRALGPQEPHRPGGLEGRSGDGPVEGPQPPDHGARTSMAGGDHG